MTIRPVPSISLCMIVKDEEQWLARCLDSATQAADEIVLVDTGSSDRTMEIAASYQPVVVRHDWHDDFAAARNAGLERAAGDWILVLDADEELAPDSARTISALVSASRADGLLLCQRSLMPAGEIQKHDDLMITRLFRNRSEYRYEQPIHEQIRPSIERHGGRIASTDLIIIHHGYAQKNAQGKRLRAERNLRLLEKALETSPSDPYLHYQAGITYRAMGADHAAYESLKRALELGSETLESETVERIYMKMAQIALAADRLSEAARHARESLARNPSNLVSLHVLALSHVFAGQLGAAEPLFARLRRSPNLAPGSIRDLDAVIEYCRGGYSGAEHRDIRST